MFTGITIDNQKISATPHAVAYCPICNTLLKPKCGAINVWHFAHTTKDNCDPWYEPESDWHHFWKLFINNDHREVMIKVNDKKHFADITSGTGIVIELQHSHMPFQERIERELFYKNLIWVVHVKRERFTIQERPDFKSFYGEDFERCKNVKFWWKYPLRWVIKDMKCPTFIDFEDSYLLKIDKLQRLSPCKGYGKIIPISNFYEQYLKYVLAEPYLTMFNEGRLFNNV